MRERIKRLRHELKERDLDAFAVLDRTNTLYFTGFHCTWSLLLVDGARARFVTDSRYAEAAEKALGSSFKVIVQPARDVRGFFKSLFKKSGYARIGFEGSITVDQLGQLRTWARGSRLVSAGDIPAGLRSVKDEEELRHIRQSVRLSEKMMLLAFEQARPGLREDLLSRRIRFAAEELGGEGESFPNIVASGPNSSRPHHQPGSRRLRKGEPLKIDLGAIRRGYCSDLTRTPILGGAPPSGFEEIYEVCLAANQAAVKALRPGVTGAEVDAVARELIAEAGYGEHFGHGLGHGVGLEIHELPTLNQRATKTKLEPGNVVTIEPGIYIPGRYGVRIEDYAVVTENGARVLSTFPRELHVIPV